MQVLAERRLRWMEMALCPGEGSGRGAGDRGHLPWCEQSLTATRGFDLSYQSVG